MNSLHFSIQYKSQLLHPWNMAGFDLRNYVWEMGHGSTGGGTPKISNKKM